MNTAFESTVNWPGTSPQLWSSLYEIELPESTTPWKPTFHLSAARLPRSSPRPHRKAFTWVRKYNHVISASMYHFMPECSRPTGTLNVSSSSSEEDDQYYPFKEANLPKDDCSLPKHAFSAEWLVLGSYHYRRIIESNFHTFLTAWLAALFFVFVFFFFLCEDECMWWEQFSAIYKYHYLMWKRRLSRFVFPQATSIHKSKPLVSTSYSALKGKNGIMTVNGDWFDSQGEELW